jgi:hypothetical protein
VSIANNVVSGSFVGRVTLIEDSSETLSPDEMFNSLQHQVADLGPGRSLQDKIEHARAQYLASDLTSACAMLGAFSAEVRAQSGKSIPSVTANKLFPEAAALRLAIGCD